MKPFHGITEEAMVDFLYTAVANDDNLTSHDYYAAEAQAVLRLLRAAEEVLPYKLTYLPLRAEDLHELACKSARKYAKSLRKGGE